MKINRRKQILQKIISEKPDAVLVSNKYKVIVGLVKRLHPNEFEKISLAKWEEIVFDAINGNRDWQSLTEGMDKENKKVLSQQWQIDEGYQPGLQQDLKKLSTL